MKNKSNLSVGHKNGFKKACLSLFIFVFFVKLVFALLPFIAQQVDKKALYAIIMQLELEDNSSKEQKEFGKKDWLHPITTNILFSECKVIVLPKYLVFDDKALQTFFPSVATPPPNV
ncbi:MAG: hypothetical protein ABI390_08650 [Daejeonella sp.]